jgi:hypothetical protein
VQGTGQNPHQPITLNALSAWVGGGVSSAKVNTAYQCGNFWLGSQSGRSWREIRYTSVTELEFMPLMG